MVEYRCNDKLYYQSELFLNQTAICHGFTSRLGGVSNGKITGLNLGFRVGDDPNSVLENYKLICHDLNLNYKSCVLAKQTHTDNIRIVTEDDAGKGLIKESDIQDTDGLITNIKGIPLIVFTADCVPILLFDPKKEVIAAIHSGWRGTVKEIGGKAVEMMKEHFGSEPKNIIAAIGPSLGECCFEFGKDDADCFPKEYHSKQNNDKVYIDLWAMNKDILISRGVLARNIDISNLCTVCNSDIFYSYRTHRENTGRQSAVIMLK